MSEQVYSNVSDGSTVFNSDNTFIDTNNAVEMMTTTSYYDYYEVVTRQDAIINKIDEQTKMINTSLCFISFLFIIFFLYSFIRNMLGRR